MFRSHVCNLLLEIAPAPQKKDKQIKAADEVEEEEDQAKLLAKMEEEDQEEEKVLESIGILSETDFGKSIDGFKDFLMKPGGGRKVH